MSAVNEIQIHGRFAGPDTVLRKVRQTVVKSFDDNIYQNFTETAADCFNFSNSELHMDEVYGSNWSESVEDAVKQLIKIPELKFEFEIYEFYDEGIEDRKYIFTGEKLYLLLFTKDRKESYKCFLLDKDLREKKLKSIPEFTCGNYYSGYAAFPNFIYLKN